MTEIRIVWANKRYVGADEGSDRRFVTPQSWYVQHKRVGALSIDIAGPWILPTAIFTFRILVQQVLEAQLSRKIPQRVLWGSRTSCRPNQP